MKKPCLQRLERNPLIQHSLDLMFNSTFPSLRIYIHLSYHLFCLLSPRLLLYHCISTTSKVTTVGDKFLSELKIIE